MKSGVADEMAREAFPSCQVSFGAVRLAALRSGNNVFIGTSMVVCNQFFTTRD